MHARNSTARSANAARRLSAVLALVATVGAGEAQAAATPMAPPGTTPFELLSQAGSRAGLTVGDFVSSVAGLDSPFRYYVEVPPGTGQLVIQLFDADVRGSGSHDRIVPTFGFRPDLFINTRVRYSIFDPGGALRAEFTCGRATNGLGAPMCPTFDDVWAGFPVNAASPTGSTFANPAAGHWEVRVDSSSAVTNGDDINGYGLSAHDGTPGAGGTELNIYVDSFMPPGKQPPATSASQHTYHPYVTAGCTATANEFDWDDSGSLTLTSFTGAFAATFSDATLSGDATWEAHALAGWTSATRAADYGVWQVSADLTGPPNYASLYVGAFDAAAPPPTAQPQASTFRIYLPTDAGSAPSKLVIGQEIIGPVSGPDPLQPETPSVIRIAVGISNPTAHAITFSAPGDVVTIAVPAGVRTRYRGNAVATVGGVASQPAINATAGNVVWDPGSLAPGASAQLEYDLEVTPPAAGSLTVTGSPGAGGTTAVYLDETGNGAQARARYTFGPLCELSVMASDVIATLAQVTGLEAWASADGGAVVEWRTMSEVGTVGFHLERLGEDGEWVRVNDSLLPAMLHSRLGATYRLEDPAVTPGDVATYRLLELEATGSVLEHGPYDVLVSHEPPPPLEGRTAARPAPGYERVARALDAVTAARGVGHRAARAAAGAAQQSRSGDRVKVVVRDAGLVRLEATATAPSLGLTAAEFASLARTGGLALSNRGRPVATRIVTGNDGLDAVEFVAERIDSQYTDANVYWLEPGQGLPMPTRPGAYAPFVPGRSFEHTVLAEQNRYALTHLFDDPDDDYWMWDFRFGGMDLLPACTGSEAGCNVHRFPLASPGVDRATSLRALLRVRLHGASRTAAAHRVTVTLNGVTLGETSWRDLLPHEVTFEVDPALLDESGNHVEIEAADSGLPDAPSVVYINDLSLSYPRVYRMADGALAANVNGHRGITVTGLASEDVTVFDLSQPTEPRILLGRVRPFRGELTVSFRSGGHDFLVVERARARAPDALVADVASGLAGSDHLVDYLIVTTSDLAVAASRLADRRQRLRGLRSKVVTMEDVYDEFAHGIADAEALWRFLHHAHTEWAVGPRYVLLAGEGSIDYKNRLGHGDALVPTLLAPTPDGLFPSDNLLADVDGNDLVPDLLIGRLPVVDAAELDTMVEKIVRYEAALDPVWARSAVLAADAPDAGGDFPASSEALAALFPTDYAVERIHLDELPRPLATERLLDALESGQAFTNFVGHGGLGAVGNTGLLEHDDLDALAADAPPTVLTAQTCLIGQFSLPGVDTIGEALVLRPHGGAIALWGPSGLSFNARAQQLGEGFYRGTFEQGELVIGEAVLAAKRRYAAQSTDGYLLDIYNLLGDPALLMK